MNHDLAIVCTTTKTGNLTKVDKPEIRTILFRTGGRRGRSSKHKLLKVITLGAVLREMSFISYLPILCVFLSYVCNMFMFKIYKVHCMPLQR